MNYKKLGSLRKRYGQVVNIKRADLEDDAVYSDIQLSVSMVIIPNRRRQVIQPDGEVRIRAAFNGYLSPVSTIRIGDIIFDSTYADKLFISNVFHIEGDDIMLLDIERNQPNG